MAIHRSLHKSYLPQFNAFVANESKSPNKCTPPPLPVALSPFSKSWTVASVADDAPPPGELVWVCGHGEDWAGDDKATRERGGGDRRRKTGGPVIPW